MKYHGGEIIRYALGGASDVAGADILVTSPSIPVKIAGGVLLTAGSLLSASAGIDTTFGKGTSRESFRRIKNGIRRRLR